MADGTIKEYYIPTGVGDAEFTEKRSRFIGRTVNVNSEEEARKVIAEERQKYYDARHTCWCYIIRDGGIMRYSDDGEPQGTAGQPMLEVFRRNGVENVCCTVTRYFGGVLLGAGGLVRAYSHTAKLSLDAAGISVVRMWKAIELECSYSQYERVLLETENYGGIVENTDFGAAILLSVLIPEQKAADYMLRLTDMSAGTIFAMEAGDRFMPAPYKLPLKAE